MSGDHNQYQKPTSKDSLQVKAMKQAVNRLITLTSYLDPHTPPYVMDEADETIDALCKAIEQGTCVEGACPYLEIHDAVVRDNDRAHALLEQCFDEMGYAGWNKLVADQQGQWNVFNALLEFLHPPEGTNEFNPDYDAMAVLVEENQRLANHLSELKDWEAIAADQAMTIAIMKSEQAEFQELVAKVQELEKQACEIIRREWVGLTEMDMLELNRKYYPRTFELMIAVEKKLKEKNTGVTGDK